MGRWVDGLFGWAGGGGGGMSKGDLPSPVICKSHEL